MGIIGVASSNGYLECIETDGVAISEPILEDSLDNGLTAHYLLGNDATDETGNHDGTAHGGVVFNGNMAEFDGVDDYIETLPSSDFDFRDVSESPFTISQWVNISVLPINPLAYSVFNVGSEDFKTFGIGFRSTGTLEIIGSNSGLQWDLYYESSYVYTANQTILLTITRNTSGVYDIYINGSFTESFVFNSDILLNNNSIKIGAHYSLNGDYMLNGKISNTRIYNEAKDQEFITKLYNEEYNASQSQDEVITGVSNVVGEFNFANISTATVADELATNEKIKDGDKLVIVKDDDSIHEVVASGVILDVLHKWETIGSDVFLSSDEHTVSAYNTDAHINRQCYSSLYSENILVKFVYNNSVNLIGLSTVNNKQDTYFASVSTGYAVECTSGRSYHNGIDIDIGFTTSPGDIITLEYIYSTGEYYMSSTINSRVLAYTLPPNTPVYIAASIYYKDSQLTILRNYQMDTTSITQGEVPSRVYRVDEKVKFNGVNAGSLSNNYYFIPTPLTDNACLNVSKGWSKIRGVSGISVAGCNNLLFNSTRSVILSNFIGRGDFDISVDLDINSFTPHSSSGVVALGASNSSGNYIIRFEFSNTYFFHSYSDANGYVLDKTNTPAQLVCSLRLVRTGSTVISYYKTTGGWVQNGNGLPLNGGDISFSISTDGWAANPIINTNIKNFAVSGDICYPVGSTRTFNEVYLSGDITTEVDMSAVGNKMTKLNFDIMKEQ